MKKVLSFVLVLAMILGSVSMAFAISSQFEYSKYSAKPFSDAENSMLATVLRDLKVLEGDNGKVFLENTITRAEICAILMRVLGFESYCTADYAINGESSFSDVKPGAWYNGYINIAAQKGFVEGIGDGKFNPTGKVKLADGVAFILKALGYEEKHLLYSWPQNYLLLAEDEGLLKGVSEATGELTREQMFTILYNAMDKPFVKWVVSSELVAYLSKDDSNGDWAKDYTKTFAIKAAGAGAKASLYTTKPAIVDPTEIAAAVAEGLDISKYAGKYVAMVVESNAALTKHRAIAVGGELTTTLAGEPTLNAAKNIVSFAGVTITGPALTTPNINDAYVIVNGKVGTWADQSANLKKSVDSSMEVGLNAKGEICSIASISVWVGGVDHMITEKEAEKLQSGIVASQKAVATAWGNSVLVSPGAAKDGSEDVILKLEVIGAATKLEDIKEDDVVTVYADSTGEIHRIVVCRDVVTGIISKSQVKSGVQYLTVGGKAYPAVSGFNTAFNYVSQHALYLDAEGSVYDLENVETPTVAKATWTKAIVASATAVKASYLEGTKLVDKTYATVSLVPFGTSTAVKYENVSPKALEVFFSNPTNVDTCAANPSGDFALGKIVEFALKGEELASVRAISANTTYAAATALINKNNPTGITVSALGIASDNKLFADDVEIYVVSQAAAGATAKVKMLAKASAAGLVFKDITYHLNASGKIDALFCYNEVVVEAEVVPDHVTIAAIIGQATNADGTYLIALVDGKEVELYEDDTLIIAPAIGSICALDLEDDEVISASKAATYKVAGGKADGKTSILVDGLKYVGGVLSTSNAALTTYTEVGQFIKPVIYVVKDTSVTTIDEATFAETAAKYTYAEYVDFNGDGYYDFLVVGAPDEVPTTPYIYN